MFLGVYYNTIVVTRIHCTRGFTCSQQGSQGTRGLSGQSSWGSRIAISRLGRKTGSWPKPVVLRTVSYASATRFLYACSTARGCADRGADVLRHSAHTMASTTQRSVGERLAKAARAVSSRVVSTLPKQPQYVSGSGRCKVSQPVVQASAPRETSYRRPPGSGTCHSRIANAARWCGTLRNAKGEPLWLCYNRRRKWSRTSPRGARLRRLNRLRMECVALESLKAPASAERWKMKGMG